MLFVFQIYLSVTVCWEHHPNSRSSRTPLNLTLVFVHVTLFIILVCVCAGAHTFISAITIFHEKQQTTRNEAKKTFYSRNEVIMTISAMSDRVSWPNMMECLSCIGKCRIQNDCFELNDCSPVNTLQASP